MRHLAAAGGLAVTALVCCLLFSAAASASQASDSITITAVVNGTTITLTVGSSPVSDISFFGGSNWHFTAVSSAGGNCSLTPTNGGAFCSYSTPVTSFDITTTITGTPPTAVDGQVGYADASTGTFSAPVTQAGGKCDWTVAFVSPPSYARSFPIDYQVTVANMGTANCDPAPLTIASQPKEFATDPSDIEIPGLKPGESYTASFAINPKPGFDYWFARQYDGTPRIGLDATMPLDDDKTPVDETDHASTKLLPEVATFLDKQVEVDTECPANITTTHCAFDLFVVIFFAHQHGTTARGQTAATSRPVVIGTIHGTVRQGKRGLIRYRLNKTGRNLLRKTHKLPVNLIGTRQQGSVTTLIKGHVTLH